MKLVFAVLLLAACSPHQRRIDQARSDGNEALVECLESCDPNDGECDARCQQTFPTKWYHRYDGAAKPLIAAGHAFEAKVAVALHPMAVADARQHNPPLAACYEQCEPAAGKCLRGCDGTHAKPEDARRRREMYLAVAKVGLEVYMQERARKQPSTGTASSSGDATSSSGSTSSSTGSTGSRPPKPEGTSCGPHTCTATQRCITYLPGTKQCAAGGQCWTVEQLSHECK